MITIGVFAGSRNGEGWTPASHAHQLGNILGNVEDVSVLYGGENTGLQHIFATSFLSHSPNIDGAIVERHVELGMQMKGLRDCKTFTDFSARKRYIYDTVDICVALPGGVGTMDEIFNFLTYSYENELYKPLVLIDTNKIFSRALQPLIDAGFLYRESMAQIQFADNPGDALKYITDLEGRV